MTTLSDASPHVQSGLISAISTLALTIFTLVSAVCYNGCASDPADLQPDADAALCHSPITPDRLAGCDQACGIGDQLCPSSGNAEACRLECARGAAAGSWCPSRDAYCRSACAGVAPYGQACMATAAPDPACLSECAARAPAGHWCPP